VNLSAAGWRDDVPAAGRFVYAQRIGGETTAPRVIRNSRTYLVPVMVGGVFLLQGLVNSSPNLTVFFLVAGPLVLLLGLWPRLIVSPDGVTVVNARAHKLPWDEIDSVDARVHGRSVNLVFRTGGEDLRAFAMRGSTKGYLNSREIVERVAAEIDEERRRRTTQVAAATA
jgi:hypothetical protein